MKIVLFANDSYFAYLLARHVVEKFSANIEVVVFSKKIKGSLKQLIDVFRKTHWRYFLYRSLVQLISYCSSILGRKSVSSLIKQHNIRTLRVSNVNTSPSVQEIAQADLALAFNFDQIINEKLIKSFKIGVINVHASRLPMDKGVSPVLWAFARGDKSIWSTIYQIDGGLDTGDIYRQFEIPVREKDTVFSIYERVCDESGIELARVLELLLNNEIKSSPQGNDTKGNYWGWPDRTHMKMMAESERKFINLKDMQRAFSKELKQILEPGDINIK